MKQVYYTKIGNQLVMAVLTRESYPRECLVEDLKRAVDALSGDIKTCTGCGQITYKHEDFICSDCGTQGGLRMVKP